jgi:uncharacterized protein (TIGR02145 family)
MKWLWVSAAILLVDGAFGQPSNRLNGGNVYSTVWIGNQLWMSTNLNTVTYQNGDVIQEVQDPEKWERLTTGAWCYYNNDPTTEKVYGKLYNWYAVTDSRGLCKVGGHVPKDEEWQVVIDYLGGYKEAGTKMREAGSEYWRSSGGEQGNSSGFAGLPGGIRGVRGKFMMVGARGNWWSSSFLNATSSWYRFIDVENNHIYRSFANYKHFGMSVRCIGN